MNIIGIVDEAFTVDNGVYENKPLKEIPDLKGISYFIDDNLPLKRILINREAIDGLYIQPPVPFVGESILVMKQNPFIELGAYKDIAHIGIYKLILVTRLPDNLNSWEPVTST